MDGHCVGVVEEIPGNDFGVGVVAAVVGFGRLVDTEFAKLPNHLRPGSEEHLDGEGRQTASASGGVGGDGCVFAVVDAVEGEALFVVAFGVGDSRAPGTSALKGGEEGRDGCAAGKG